MDSYKMFLEAKKAKRKKELVGKPKNKFNE